MPETPRTETVEDAARQTVRAYNRFWMLVAEGRQDDTVRQADDEVHDAIDRLAQSVGLIAWSDTGKERARA